MTPSIIKHDRVHFEGAGTPRNEPGDSTSTAPARSRVPKGVRLLERDGHVHAIELTCACGEVSVVELDYGAPQQTRTTQSPPKAEET